MRIHGSIHVLELRHTTTYTILVEALPQVQCNLSVGVMETGFAVWNWNLKQGEITPIDNDPALVPNRSNNSSVDFK